MYYRLKWSKEDPKIYTLGAGDTQTEELTLHGFQLQNAAARQLGYPEMDTLADFEAAIRSYMEQYPKIYGLDTVGLSLLFDEQGFERTVMEPAVVSTGLPYQGDWYVDQNNMVDVYKRQEVDIVVIMPTTNRHEELAIAAANAKKHILISKPLARTLAGADRIIPVSYTHLILFHRGDILAEPFFRDCFHGAVGRHLSQGFFDLFLQGVVAFPEADDIVLCGQRKGVAITVGQNTVSVGIIVQIEAGDNLIDRNSVDGAVLDLQNRHGIVLNFYNLSQGILELCLLYTSRCV